MRTGIFKTILPGMILSALMMMVGNAQTNEDQQDDSSNGLSIANLGSLTALSDEEDQSLSDEQDFEAVSQRETIESDAQRRSSQRESLRVYSPIFLPERVGEKSVVNFALGTQHLVGTKMYKRPSYFNEQRYVLDCRSFLDEEAAQQAFLDAGGPGDDKLKIDPDGDGFACGWDPEKYRRLLK